MITHYSTKRPKIVNVESFESWSHAFLARKKCCRLRNVHPIFVSITNPMIKSVLELVVIFPAFKKLLVVATFILRHMKRRCFKSWVMSHLFGAVCRRNFSFAQSAKPAPFVSRPAAHSRSTWAKISRFC